MLQHDDLIARACESIAQYLALGCETFEAHGAVFVRNRATPTRYDANHAGRVRTSDAAELDALLQRLDQEYAGFGHRRIDIDPLTPPQVAARLTLEPGYTSKDELFLILEGPLNAAPKPFEIREVVSEQDWRAYDALDRSWWHEMKFEHWDEDVMRYTHMQKRRKSQLGVRFWLALAKGEVAGFLASWPGENGVGQVEDLYVLPQYRHRGIATALIAHCVDDARARGAEAVVIGADVDDTPKLMYAALGFRPSFLTRSYLRVIK